MSRQDLKQKAISSMLWSAVQRYSVMFIQFVSDLILARLLSPYDFGCIGMLVIFMTVAETFIDGGFGSALIQKKSPTQNDYSTVFFWNLGMSAFLYVLLFLCAPLVARFFDIPLLSSILRVQGLILFVYAFNIIQANILKKKLDFKALSIVSVITSIVSLGVTILMAYKGFGVWSLVARNLIAACLTSLIFWFYVKWRPIFVFSWVSFKELFSFGFYMFLTHLVTNISTRLQDMLVGKVYNPTTLGYYSKADSTEGLVSRTFSRVLTQVTYPLYAKVQNDLIAVQNIVKRLTMTLSYLTFPLMFILILVAKPLFILLYTEKWLPSVIFFQVLCLAGFAHSLQSVNFQTISAIGKSKITFKWTIIKRMLGMAFVVGGLALWGMNGLLCGTVLNAWFAYFVNMGLVSKHIGYKWWRQLYDLLPVVIAALFIGVLVYFGTSFMDLNIYVDGIIKTIVYIAVYLLWSVLFKPEAYTYTISIVSSIVDKIFGRNKSK